MALWSTAFGVSGKAELAGYSLAGIVWYLAMTETVILSTSARRSRPATWLTRWRAH
jgi:hypothetical protein